MGGHNERLLTSTCFRSALVRYMPSAPPAQAPEMSCASWAEAASSSSVGTYGGLNMRTSTLCDSLSCRDCTRDVLTGCNRTLNDNVKELSFFSPCAENSTHRILIPSLHGSYVCIFINVGA